MLTTQGLASGTLGELRAALAAFADSGVPATATVSTKRSRLGRQLTEVSAEWTPSVEADDGPSDGDAAGPAPPIPRSSN